MQTYRIHRMKENASQSFRWQPHTSGVTLSKPRDYEAGQTVEADSAYAAWMALRDTAEALRVGDILESETGEMRIYKYVGFEEARWVVPEVKSGMESLPAAAGPAPEAHSAGPVR